MAEDRKAGSRQRSVFVYMDDWPFAVGSGAHLRFHSNIAAWVDNGWQVTAVRVAERSTAPPEWPGVTMEEVLCERRPANLAGRLQYRFGYAGQAGCAYYFSKHEAMRRAVAERHRRVPGALHQLEGDSVANVAPFLHGIEFLFSHHDLSAEALESIYRMSAGLEERRLLGPETREIRFMQAAELAICHACRPILCISGHDQQILARRFGLEHAVYFPMSVTPESAVPKLDLDPGRLCLLHIGKINHLPTFRSLEHLLGEVFPLLPAATLARIRLRVAGRLDPDEPKCKHILSLAEPYRDNVEMAGFVDNLAGEYARADLQVVASTDATGLRTRIIESMAWGVPVLSTRVAARGIGGLEGGENILLADDKASLAAALERLAGDKQELARIAAAARETYRKLHSRAAVAENLAALLRKYYPRQAES